MELFSQWIRRLCIVSMYVTYVAITEGYCKTIGEMVGSNENLEKCMDYLHKYSYVDEQVDSDMVNSMDPSEVEATIRQMQRYMPNIQVTGVLDNATMAMMDHPRCGVPDINGESDGTIRGRVRRYSHFGGRWEQHTITYRILNTAREMGLADVREAVRRAFDVWEEEIPRTFTEIFSGLADIEISFKEGAHGDVSPFDGIGGTLAHAFAPTNGDVHFDDAELYTLGTPEGTNLFQVAVHEIGHSLGLGHSMNDKAVMAPFYTGYEPNLRLSNDDVLGIQSRYASATNRWRADYRCGGEFYAPNGEIAECDPEGTNPCCSPFNWCDVTPSHCECEGCIDYRVTAPMIEDIRLAEGRTVNMGRVEVRVNGVWGTVCDDLWDINDATVTCKQLGYPGAEAARQDSYFGTGSDTIWLDNVECVGDETTLDDCPKNDIGDENCGGSEHAGVVCLPWETPPASATNRWRADYRCGGEFYAPNGEIAECDPEGTNPCCSPYNWCDVTPSHCECEGCIDYRVTVPEPCNPNPCLNEGQCYNLGATNDPPYICICAEGFNGPKCETEVIDDPCASFSCNNGVCESNTGTPQCICSEGFTGTFCDTIISICDPSPCGPNGFCLDWFAAPLCFCLFGYTGTFCDVLDERAWRDDNRCGGYYVAPNGKVAECNPEGIYPCCSPYNWCGNTAYHCDCEKCIDYRATEEGK